MANRDALRELQGRLATRLQTAQAEGAVVSWLAVESGGRGYLFPLGQSGEIFPWVEPQSVPYTTSWFLGVVNLRGGLYGVVDFSAMVAAFIPGHPVPPARSEVALADCRLLGLSPALEVNAVLVVDHLAGLRGVDAFVRSGAPDPGLPGFFGNVLVDAQGRSWQEINLSRLSQDARFLGIGI